MKLLILRVYSTSIILRSSIHKYSVIFSFLWTHHRPIKDYSIFLWQLCSMTKYDSLSYYLNCSSLQMYGRIFLFTSFTILYIILCLLLLIFNCFIIINIIFFLIFLTIVDNWTSAIFFILKIFLYVFSLIFNCSTIINTILSLIFLIIITLKPGRLNTIVNKNNLYFTDFK